MYHMDASSDCSILIDLSHQYVSTQHGTAGYQHATGSSQHGTVTSTYSTQHGGGPSVVGYFAGEVQQSAGHGSVAGVYGVDEMLM